MRFLLGLGMGYVVGLLWAPASGEQTRSQIVEKAHELSEIPAKKAAEAAQEAKQKAGEIGSRVGRQAAEAAVQAVSDELSRRKETA
jgi:gas vesicle protein